MKVSIAALCVACGSDIEITCTGSTLSFQCHTCDVIVYYLQFKIPETLGGTNGKH